jgi:hypothetical protein
MIKMEPASDASSLFPEVEIAAGITAVIQPMGAQ